MAAFIPTDFTIQQPADVEILFQKLLDRNIQSVSDFEHFLIDVSELESFLSEDMAWRYIHMTCDTQNEDFEKAYLQFVQEIQPKIAPFEDKLNQKIVDCQFKSDLESAPEYHIYFRALKSAVDLFREENIPLQADLNTLAQEYSSIQGAMTIDLNGETMTMQKASNFLMETDREVRENAWKLMNQRRQQDAQKLEDLFDNMVAKRHQVAVNAGFNNYRDYMFAAMGRFDYSVDDCKKFHESVEIHVVPLLKEIQIRRLELMKIDKLKPWDTAVDPLNREPLKPFTNGVELLDKGIAALNELDSFFGNCLTTMKEKSLLDLDSRVGKAPGGYNYPLAKTNMPFIFMNATGNLRDVETLVHEAGHAIHSFQMAPLKLNAFKNTPSEVAELASMSMELLSMDGWENYFIDETLLNRAKCEQLEGILGTLPWIATVDAFQHWIYENPNHSQEERKAAWIFQQARFSSGLVDYTGFEDAKAFAWHKQLHIFEVPFYYIEYGFAQLGAIGIWKNYHQDKTKALEGYKSFMKLGYTQSIPNIYENAGVKFEFSSDYIKQLMEFVHEKWAQYK
jgi:oligoendopeptidase F